MVLKLGWFLCFDRYKNKNSLGHYFFVFDKVYYSGDLHTDKGLRTGVRVEYSVMIMFFGVKFIIER